MRSAKHLPRVIFYHAKHMDRLVKTEFENEPRDELFMLRVDQDRKPTLCRMMKWTMCRARLCPLGYTTRKNKFINM